MKINKLVSGVLLIGCLTGCTSVWKVPISPAAFPPTQKVNSRVQLVLTEELRNAEWCARINPTDSAKIQVGEDLAKNAENLARSIFSEVSVNQTTPSAGTPNTDAVLTPKLITFERTQPTTIFGQQTTTMVLEWRLANLNGDTLWVDTVKGEKTQKMSSNPKRSAQEQVQAAFADLFAKSYASMSAAPEIRRLSKQ